jgi:RHS repeat-associated protein
MATDTVLIGVEAFYNSAGQNNGNSSTVADMVTALLGAFGGSTSAVMDGAGHYTIGQRNATTFTAGSYTGIGGLKSSDPNADAGKPKAYLNWILFDEQFNIVTNSTSSGTRQVKSGPDVKDSTLTSGEFTIAKNGYLYIYVSNESPMDVFFDKLAVEHRVGRIVSEDHYYAYGLTMAGISSKALNFGGAENKRKFNDGTELNTDFDVNLYETSYRPHDPQIGRFHQIDPLAGIADDYSPYSYVLNNPLLFNDPYGLDTTRGNTPKPAPDPGDIWTPDEGPNQIFDADRGWAPQVELSEVVVGPNSSAQEDEDGNTNASSGWETGYFYTSTAVGAAGSYFGFKGNITHNEWWWKQKNGTWRWRNNATKSNYLFKRSYQLTGKALAKAKTLSTRLAAVNVALIVSDVIANKQISASHLINGAMTAISFTGVGSVVAGLWFVADLGTQLVTGRSLSERLDELVGQPLADWSDE